MADTKCTYCNGPYCDLKKAEESFEKITRTYYCNSCRREFRISQTKPAPSGTWLMTFTAGTAKDTIRFYRDTDGTVHYLARVAKYEELNDRYLYTYVRERNAPTIYASGIEICLRNPGKPYYDSYRYFDYSESLWEVEINGDMTRIALENPAMRAVHLGGNRFNLRRIENDQLRKDVAQWLRTTLRANSLESETRASSGGCYIATAVYGSYDCPQVWTLRRFRDNVLAPTWYGSAFIRMYYAISPALVKWFGNAGWFQKLWRRPLDRMVEKLQNRGIESSPYQDRIW